MQRPTHEVTNQAPELKDYNLFTTDLALCGGVRSSGAAWQEERLKRFGAELSKKEVIRLGELANRHLPELNTYDRFGFRIDHVTFHPSGDALLRHDSSTTERAQAIRLFAIETLFLRARRT